MNNFILNEDEIIRLGEKYRCKCKVYPHNSTILITRNSDEFIAQVNYDYIDLNHINKSGNRTGKHHYHPQRSYKKIEHMFDSIHNHVPRYKITKKLSRMDYLFSLI